MTGMATTKSHPVAAEDWDRLRPIFTGLYMKENRALPEVMKIMEDKYDFKAT